jgi:hypothetical protein
MLMNGLGKRNHGAPNVRSGVSFGPEAFLAPKSVHPSTADKHYAPARRFRADFVAKVENRTTQKISQTLIFS